jgi:hypothetical protein
MLKVAHCSPENYRICTLNLHQFSKEESYALCWRTFWKQGKVPLLLERKALMRLKTLTRQPERQSVPKVNLKRQQFLLPKGRWHDNGYRKMKSLLLLPQIKTRKKKLLTPVSWRCICWSFSVWAGLWHTSEWMQLCWALCSQCYIRWTGGSFPKKQGLQD